MPNKYLVVLIFLSLLLVSASSALASDTSSKDFYDYGPWYYRGPGRVLAETTSSAQASSSASTQASASATAQSSNASASAVQADVKTSTGLLPDNPFYFFKPFGESLTLTFTFNPQSREERRLSYTEERLSEIKALLEKKNYPLASSNFKRYQSIMDEVTKNLESLRERNVEVGDLAKKVELNNAKHSLVLEKMDLIVPDNIKDNLQLALDASQNSMDRTSDVLGRSPIPAELKERLDSLKNLGILKEEEVNAIYSLKTREEVRKKLEALAKQNILPEADTKKLDESQAAFFPADFLRIFEVKKLYEFKRLEELKPDEVTQKKMTEFASVYKPGDPIPTDLQKWWVPLQRYQELQNTLRPDIVVNIILPKDGTEYKKFEDIFNRFRPSEDQLKSVENWAKENPGKAPPPDIQRIASLAVNLGSPSNWHLPDSLRDVVNTGYPTYYPQPAGFGGQTLCKDPEECRKLCEKDPSKCGGGGYQPGNQGGGYIPGSPQPYCINGDTKAKNSYTGEIKIFPNSCIPTQSGWYVYYGNEKAGQVAAPYYSPGPNVGTYQTGCFGGQYPDGRGGCKCPDEQTFYTPPNGNYREGYCKDRNASPSPYRSYGPNECAPGWENRDGNWSNGCEYYTSNPAFTCANGWVDKDGNASNGCEYYTGSGTGGGYSSFACTDSMHCSALYSNTQAKWNITCYSGWENRDATITNGCEYNSGTGTSTSPSPSPSTSSGFSCAGGWEDRDGNASNGCEYYNSGSGSGSGTTTGGGSPGSFACTDAMHCSALYSNSEYKWNITCYSGWENRDGNDSNGCEYSSGSTSSPSPSSSPSYSPLPSPSYSTSPSPSPSESSSYSPSPYTSTSP